MKFFSYDSKPVQFIALLSRMTLITVIWLLGCLPILTAGASSAGMYYALNCYRLGDIRLWRNYRTGVGKHWKRATVFWLFCFALMAGLFGEWFMSDFSHLLSSLPLTIVATVAILAFTFMALWFFPVMMNFSGKFGEIIGNAFIFSVLYTPLTLATIAMYAVLIYLAVTHPIVFGVCFVFSPGLIAYTSLLLYEIAFRKYRNG